MSRSPVWICHRLWIDIDQLILGHTHRADSVGAGAIRVGTIGGCSAIQEEDDVGVVRGSDRAVIVREV